MPDDAVALASVIVSGLVALGGLVVTYLNGRHQRRHERRLAYEERAWEKKSEGLLRVIATTRGLLDTVKVRQGWRRDMIAVDLMGASRSLDELVAVVEAYASADCRSAFEELRTLLRESGFDIELIRRQKEEAIDAGDFERAARLKDRDQGTWPRGDAVDLDFNKVETSCLRLIETARESVQGKT